MASSEALPHTPFLLRVFYKINAYPSLSLFDDPNTFSQPPTSMTQIPNQITIHAWQTTTLLSLSHQILASLPTHASIPNPIIGTRLCFRLLFPDTRPSTTVTHIKHNSETPKWLSRDLGSVIVGEVAGESEEERREAKMEEDVKLEDGKFIVGDFLLVAILPVLEDGSVAPKLAGIGNALNVKETNGRLKEEDAAINGRVFQHNRLDNATPRRGGAWRGRRGGYGRGGRVDVPVGDWRRG